MKIANVTNETENLLFKRKEIKVNIESEVTPSHAEVEKALSEKFSTNPENIRIKKISGSFGSQNFIVTANIYASKEEKESTEHFSKKQLEKMAKLQEAPAEAPAETEAPKEEAPAEEKPIEESKPEEKKEEKSE